MTTGSKTMEENVKKLIYSILTSTPLTVTIQELSKDYRNNIGEPIPYHKYGYNSLEHFLKSIPDIAQVRGNGPLAQVLPVTSNHAKSAHVNELVTKQRLPVSKKKSFCASMAKTKRKMHYPAPTRFPPEQYKPPRFCVKYQEPIKEKPPENQTPIQLNTSNHNAESTSPNNMKTIKSLLELNIQPPSISNTELKSTNNSNKLKTTKNVLELNNQSPSTSSTELKRNLLNTTTVKSLLELNKRHSSSKPNDDYEALKKMNEIKLSSDFYEKSNLTKPLPKKHNVSDKSQILVEKTDNIPVSVKNSLKVLISRFPDGIWCTQLLSTYRTMFHRELNYQELGYGSLIDLCLNLPSIFHFCRPGSEDFKLYDRTRPLPDCAEKKFTVASYSTADIETENNSNALPDIDWLDVLPFLPKGVFQPGNEIPRTFVPENTKANDKFDIRAGEIYDLSKFWVYLDDGKLDQLMDDLQTFYGARSSEYQMPENLVREGIYCVHFIYNEYHRALIVDILPQVEGFIRVVFIDYGTTAKVPIKGLCYLHTDFSTLPAQAIRCRLSNILPVEEGMSWTREASTCFRQSITNRKLMMNIGNVNWKEKFLEIYLADVTENDNIYYINQYLVDEGYAIFSDQKQKKSISLQSSIVKYIHLFPTFMELEFGVSPSAQEMEILYELNVPINFAYPQYFNWDLSSEEKNIEDIEEFYEKHCLSQKRDVNMHFYDLSQFTPQPLDLSIFRELQPRIEEFMEGNKITDPTQDFSEIEDINEDQATNSRDDLLKCKSTIKKDRMLSEDIMKDLQEIYVERFNIKKCHQSSEENNINSDSLTDPDQTSEYHDFFSTPPDYYEDSSNEEEFIDAFRINHSPQVSINEDLMENEEQTLFYDFRPSGIKDDIEAELQEIEDKMCSISLQDTNEESEEKKRISTNPFLQDIDDTSENNLQLVLANPNNPFLNFLDEINEVDSTEYSDASSNSTVYGTYTEEIQVKQTWSTNDGSSTDIVNTVENLSLYSGSSDSKNIDYEVSTQQADDVLSCASVPSNFQNPVSLVHQQFPPQPYHYQNNWMNYNNQYRFIPPYQGYGCNPSYEPQYNYGYSAQPSYPGYIPRSVPPGFEPRPMPQRVPLFRPPNFPYQMYPRSSVQAQTFMRATMNVHANANENKDFYEMYNQQLRSKITIEPPNSN